MRLRGIAFKKIPLVCIDRNINGIITPLVTTTNSKNMEQIVSLLAGRGHSRIGFFSVNDRMAITEEERFNGFCSGMIKNNLKTHKDYIFDNTDMHKRELTLTQPKQSKLFNKYVSKCLDLYESLNPKPTAICCINDKSMSAFMNEAVSRGIKVPEDLTLAGFDCEDEGYVRSKQIITVKQNFFGMGASAMRLLLKILDGQNYHMKELIDGTLIK